MKQYEKTLKKDYLFNGIVVNLRRDQAELPDGRQAVREVVEHPGGVGIALEDEEGKFFMVTQYRYAQERVMLEFPAGTARFRLRTGPLALRSLANHLHERVNYERSE